LRCAGAMRREIANTHPVVIARESARPSSVPSMIDSLEVKVFYPA